LFYIIIFEKVKYWSNMEEVFTNPTDLELTIVGEFLGIEVGIYSFTVKTNLYIDKQIPLSYRTCRHIFPLKYMQRFFKVNSKTPTSAYFERLPTLEPNVYIGGVLVDR
jgi:hypothetical protein